MTTTIKTMPRAEQSRAEQSRAEQSRAEQSRRLGNALDDERFTGCNFGYTVWDAEYLCPTLNSAQGGGRQPYIVEIVRIDDE